MPNVGADEVSEVGGINALDIVRVDCCKIMVVLTSFLPTNENNSSRQIYNQYYIEIIDHGTLCLFARLCLKTTITTTTVLRPFVQNYLCLLYTSDAADE